MGIFFKPPSQGFNPANGDKLRDTRVHSIPPNLGRGNSSFDALWYWLFRETMRALTRLLLGVELQDSGVSPVTVTVGHAHDEEQEAALPWLQAGVGIPSWQEGDAFNAAHATSTTEADLLWLPITIPNGCNFAYVKVLAQVISGDIAMVRCRYYHDASMNAVVPLRQSGFLDISGGPDGILKWVEFDAVDLSVLTVVDGVKSGWLRLSGLVKTAGMDAKILQVSVGLRQGD